MGILNAQFVLSRLDVINMMHPYLTFDDGTEVVHSDLITEGGVDTVFIHFERPKRDGFDSARCRLPEYSWTQWEGSFSEAEMATFEAFIRNNAHLLYTPLFASVGARSS